MTSGNESSLPAQLGLAGGRLLGLPQRMRECPSGDRCSWRWLAEAVHQETSWLRDDLNASRNEHQAHLVERNRDEQGMETSAQLRGAHEHVHRELTDLRLYSQELRLQVEAQKSSNQQQSHDALILDEKLMCVDAEIARLNVKRRSKLERVEGARRELARIQAHKYELEWNLQKLVENQAHTELELRKLKSECTAMSKTCEKAEQRGANRAMSKRR